jgi:hypothetical protein
MLKVTPKEGRSRPGARDVGIAVDAVRAQAGDLFNKYQE